MHDASDAGEEISLHHSKRRYRSIHCVPSFGFSAASIDLIAAALEFDPSRSPKKANEFALRIAQDLHAIHRDA